MLFLKQVNKELSKQISIAPLITFRVVFGALMLFSTIRFMALGWVEDHFIHTTFHFKYFGFYWVEALPPAGMYAVHILMIIASLMIMLGWYYRISIIVLFLSFTYTELIDITYYLNHYYFVSLALFLMIFLPAHRRFSLDIFFGRVAPLMLVPAWTIAIIKWQLGMVYVYAGLAKINHDWLLEAMPLRIWLLAKDNLPLIGWIFALPLTPWIFSWFGMLYDCTIPFWLMWKKSRPFAYVTVVVFHTLTAMLFQIGIFPVVMIAATTIFFDAKHHEWVLNRFGHIFAKKSDRSNAGFVQTRARTSRILPVLFTLFFIFQLLFPWRYLLYPGNIFWTEEGYRFSWRVMLMEKAGTATFYVRGKNQKTAGIVDNSEFLNEHQEKQMAMQPDLILQYAHFLKSHYEKQGLVDPDISAVVYVTLNARPSRLLIDPDLNLAELSDGWKHKNWIIPYEQ